MEAFDVFISYKNSDNGILTKDSFLARELYEFLTKEGIHAFFSGQSLADLGADRYKQIIDDTLDSCSVLIVVGTKLEYIQSSWVRYEWDSFFNDILMEKKKGKVFSYVDNINPHDLPRTLRNLQCFDKNTSSLKSVAAYVKRALQFLKEADEVCSADPDIVLSEKKIAPEREEPLADGNRNSNVNKLLQFANLISCGDQHGQYVNPYISEEMADIIAKKIDNLKEYNAEICLKEGINPVIYEVFLAQKIARINKPESCIKAFNLLHQVINSWHVFLNDDLQVAAYWIFIALEEESYDRIKTGKVDEKDISVEDVRFIDMPGRYKGYLLLSGTIEECRTTNVVNALYSSWLEYIQNLAQTGIFFDEISSMVGSVAGNSSLKNIGMKYYAEYISGGKMYKYDMIHIEQIPYLKRNFPAMTALYQEEYKEEQHGY